MQLARTRCKCPDTLCPQLERFREFNSAELGVRNWFFSSGQLSEISRVYPEGAREGLQGRKRDNRKGWSGTKEKGKSETKFVFRITEASHSSSDCVFCDNFKNSENNCSNSVFVHESILFIRWFLHSNKYHLSILRTLKEKISKK